VHQVTFKSFLLSELRGSRLAQLVFVRKDFAMIVSIITISQAD